MLTDDATFVPMVNQMRVMLFVGLIMLLIDIADADYDANTIGVVTKVLTYTSNGRIYFAIDNQPTSHAQCNPTFFAVDSAIEADVRGQLLSRLLVAYATGEAVNIGYDSAGDCAHSYIRVHRIG